MKNSFNYARRLATGWITAAFLIPQTAFSEDAASVCEQSDQEAKPLFRVPPAYPENAGAFCIEGSIVVKGEVGPDGRVLNAYVAESDPPYIFDEAVSVTEAWIYRPKCEDGEPVTSEFTTALDFVMADTDHAPCLNVLEGEGLEMYTHVMSMFSEHQLMASQRDDLLDPAPPLPEEPSYSGDWGKIEAFLLRSFNRSNGLSNHLHTRMEEIGWGRILDVTRLWNDTGMVESRRMLAEIHQLYDEVNGMARRLDEELDTDLERLDLSDEVREMFFGADEVDESDEEVSEYIPPGSWTALGEIEAILDLLEETRGDGWVVVDDGIFFPSPEIRAKYTAHAEALNSLYERGQLADLELLDQFWKKLESRR